MSGLLVDLRHAVRLYLTTPLATAIAVAVLAVAMAAVTALLSLWSDLALERDPGFERGDELVSIGQNDGDTFAGLSLRLLERMNAEVGSVRAVAGSWRTQQSVDGEGDRPLVVELVTAEYFPKIRPKVQLGRGFDGRDHVPAAEPAVILSHAFWREHYGRDANVMGRALRIRGPTFVLGSREGTANGADTAQSYRVIGVMASEVDGTWGEATDAWIPYEQAAATLFASAGAAHERMTWLRGVGRLAPGATTASAAAELEGRYSETDRELGVLPNRRLDVMAGLVADVNGQREVRRQVQLLLVGSGLLALVAASNVSLFLLSRAPGRRRELGIRLVVGAPMRRLARQMATEAGLLVVTAALIGLIVSVWLAALMRDLPFLSGPYWRSVSPLEWPVLAITAGVTIVLALLVSLAPIAGVRRLGIASASHALASRPGWTQRVAATVQIGAAGTLTAAAVAFSWYLGLLAGADRGFDGTGVHVVTPVLTGRPFAFDAEPEPIVTARERRRALIEALPGVEAAAFATSLPGRETSLARSRMPIQQDAPSGEDDTVNVVVDSAGYKFTDVMNMPVVHGRALRLSDRTEVLVNDTLARAVWGRTEVAGEPLPIGGPSGWNVVGVVRDAGYGHPAEEIPPRVLHPAFGSSFADRILIAGDLTAAGIREQLQGLIDSGELELEIGSIDRIGDLVNAQLAPDRTRTFLTLSSAGLVVVLAAFGFYGLQRYLVSAGRREFAIRAALGAGPKALGRLVVVRGIALAAPGLVLGSLLAFVVVAWLRGDFVASAVSPYLVTALVAIGLTALVLAASLGPARAARRMRAGLVLREE